MAADINLDLFRANLQNQNFGAARQQDRFVFRFDTKLEHVQQRSVRRSLDYDDDVNPAMAWGIRCVPLGHNAMFYLLRNSYPQYHEFEYDFVIVNGDGVIESGYGLRAFVGADALCDEFLQPPLNIPVHPQKNWFVIQITIRHVPETEYWYLEPNIPGPNHPDNRLMPSTSAVPTDALFPDQDQEEKPSASASYSKRLLSLFLDEMFCDCEIVCQEVVFRVHKCILAAHSIVFRSMFSHYFTRESQTARVEIHEYDPEALLVMIQWFYVGKLKPLEDETRQKFLPASASTSADDPPKSVETYDGDAEKEIKTPKEIVLDDSILLQVTELADKYALDELEDQCEQKLVERLSEANLCDFLYLADLFQLFRLKMCCHDMIRANQTRILTSPSWQQFVECNPTLVQQTLQQALEIS